MKKRPKAFTKTNLDLTDMAWLDELYAALLHHRQTNGVRWVFPDPQKGALQ